MSEVYGSKCIKVLRLRSEVLNLPHRSSSCRKSIKKTVSRKETFDPQNMVQVHQVLQNDLQKAPLILTHSFGKVPKVSCLPRGGLCQARPESARSATLNAHIAQKNARCACKTTPSQEMKLSSTLFVQACAVEMHMDISQGNFCVRIHSDKARNRWNTLI